ncbi:hypothetical protein Taro_015272 [Colocasia esculenta]|uniref:Uncharacterized protein n=1 Tax=Colocasia esculenta TaxID=4460 RepID=A0A843UHB8_COLES|nr:hypothetical protein [Colocasia esculenta]
MGQFRGRLQALPNNGCVAAMWMQSCAGAGYLFGSLSPIIKSSFSYNQQQVASLGVAKDLGDSIGNPEFCRLCFGLAHCDREGAPLTPLVCPSAPVEENLLLHNEDPRKSGQSTETNEIVFSEAEDENAQERKISEVETKLFQGSAGGPVRVKRRDPYKGENFTLMQTLKTANFWLIFISLLLGSGSGLTVIDNLGQISESLGYKETHIFVSMISIWNFLGRVGGGYFSEIVVRDYAYPRPVATSIAQVVMAIGHFFLAMAWPGTMYIAMLFIGLGYGDFWAIVPAACSELFGLKIFGALYNFLTVANPAGSLVFSGVIASSIYDYEAEKQSRKH